MFLFCIVFAMFCARLFICALWSPAGKGLTSWLSFVVNLAAVNKILCRSLVYERLHNSLKACIEIVNILPIFRSF